MNEILDKHFESIEIHRRLVWQIGMLFLDYISVDQLAIHDLSKYGSNEFRPYAEWFHDNRNQAGAYQNFQVAWQHHIRNNPHHWQYWVLDGIGPIIIKDDIDPNNAIPMEYGYIVEMVCDWQAMEIQNWSRQDMSGWLNKKFDKMTLHTQTRESVIDVLDKIGYEYLTYFVLDRDNEIAKKVDAILQKHCEAIV